MILRSYIFFAILFSSAGFISCIQYGSLGFVIDDTNSMEKEITLVRKAVDGIMDIIDNNPTSPIKNVVLVTFNDPSFLTKLYKTNTREELKKSLEGINVHGGGDCPEYSMSGILMALENSLPNSYLFVFTDAPPKDANQIHLLKRIARSKETQIIIIRTIPGTEKCRTNVPESQFYPYYELATYTHGQVFNCGSKDEVEDILTYVKLIISGGVTVIVPEIPIPPNTRTEIPFNVDDQAEYIVVSASGLNVDLELLDTSPTKEFEKITWISNAKVLKINNPEQGEYKVAVKGSSTTSIIIFARTDFTFQHGFAQDELATFNNDKKEPTDGTEYHLLVNVTDPTNSVNIQTAEILHKNEEVHLAMPLRRKSGNYYVTDKFLPPNSTFFIAIKGVGKETKKEIRRMSKTPIDSRPKDSDPIIKILGQNVLDYAETLHLTCSVTAHPQPKIAWKDHNGMTLPSQFQQLNRYNYVSYLKMDHLKISERFSCYASNDRGDATEHVDVTVKSPFVVGNRISQIIELEYGKSSSLHCDITSKFPMQIIWHFNNKEIRNSKKYSVLNGGTELSISEATETIEGTYKCIAWLTYNKAATHEIVQVVKTNAQAPIMGKSEQISVKEKESVTLRCNILNSHPAPKITWQFKKAAENTFRSIGATGTTELTISNIDLQQSGIYKCIAQNSRGTGEKETKLSVLISPRLNILINDVTISWKEVKYGETLLMFCRVTSHVMPDIKWRNGKGDILKDDKTDSVKNFEYVSLLRLTNIRKGDIYSCEAINDVSKATKNVHVTVEYPLKITTPPIVKNIGFGEKAILKCGIMSSFPTKYTWTIFDKSGKKYNIDNSEKYSLSEDGSVLTIKKMEVELAGDYNCKGTLVDDPTIQQNHKTTVTVELERPEIEIQPSVLKVKVGETAVMKCKIIKGNPPPKLTWLKKNKLGNDQIVSETELLTIKDSNYDDTASYTCVATNIAGKHVRAVQLTVAGPPLILSKEDEIYGLEGDVNLRVPCVVVGFPKPAVSWMIDGKPVVPDETYVVEDGGLIFNNPLKQEAMNYTCKAENEYGTDARSFVVTVSEILDDEYLGNTTYIYMKEGESRQLPCQSGSQPGRWYEGATLTKTIGNYTLSKVTKDQDANYTCRISNKQESYSHTYVLNVGFAPVFKTRENEKEIDVNWQGDKRHLDCQVDMKPYKQTAKVEWFVNGKVSPVKDTTHRVDGWGDYTCQISNVHGTVSRTYHVKSANCLLRRDVLNKSNLPLMLDPSGSRPELESKNSEYFYLRQNDELQLFCPAQSNAPNKFKVLPGNNQIVVKCDREDKLTFQGKTYKLTDLECEKDIKPDIKHTGEACSTSYNTELVKVGFKRKENTNGFLDVYTVCFDKSRKVPLNAQIIMKLPLNEPLSQSEWLKEDTFTNGNEKYCDDKSEKCCLVKKQLVNSQDVWQGAPQVATFIDGLNSVPVWNNCKRNITWNQVEEQTRSLVDVDIETVTGAHEYTNTKGMMVPRFLYKALWKLLDEKTFTTVIVWVNDPSPAEKDIRCHTPCDEYGVQDLTGDPYTYCCSLKEFEENFTSLSH